MKRWLLALVALPTVLLARPCVSAQSIDARALLKQAYAAEKAVPYTAVLEVRTAAGPSTRLRVWSSGGRKRMEYLSGPTQGRVLVDDGRTVYWLNPAERTAVATPTPEAADSIDLVFRNYSVTVVGTESTAGRKALAVRISPKRPPGPSRRLWIDSRTKLILRSENYASDGSLKTASKVVSITFMPELSQEQFRVPRGWQVQGPSASGQSRWTVAELSRQLGIPVSEPRYLPPGFVLDGMYLVRMGRMGREAAHIRYVDGLNSLSVFQHAGGPGRGPRAGGQGGRRWRGGRNAATEEVQELGSVGRLIRVPRPGRICVVVADLPEAELQKVADSLP
ncbi:MAG: sigma-E factor regulatory protein RseB domain-containing protein [Armatimonadota bacterium]